MREKREKERKKKNKAEGRCITFLSFLWFFHTRNAENSLRQNRCIRCVVKSNEKYHFSYSGSVEARHAKPSYTYTSFQSFFFFFYVNWKKIKGIETSIKYWYIKFQLPLYLFAQTKMPHTSTLCAYLYDENKVSLTRNFLRGTTITTISPSTIRYPQSTIFSFRYILDDTANFNRS